MDGIKTYLKFVGIWSPSRDEMETQKLWPHFLPFHYWERRKTSLECVNAIAITELLNVGDVLVIANAYEWKLHLLHG